MRQLWSAPGTHIVITSCMSIETFGERVLILIQAHVSGTVCLNAWNSAIVILLLPLKLLSKFICTESISKAPASFTVKSIICRLLEWETESSRPLFGEGWWWWGEIKRERESACMWASVYVGGWGSVTVKHFVLLLSVTNGLLYLSLNSKHAGKSYVFTNCDAYDSVWV